MTAADFTDSGKGRTIAMDADTYRTAFENTSVALMVAGRDGTILAVNPAFTRVTGWTLAEVVGRGATLLQSGRHDEAFYRDFRKTLARRGEWQGEIWNRRKSGEAFAEQLSINAVTDDRGRVVNYVAAFTDITVKKEMEERLERLAYHDFLTGLPNRMLFMDRLAQALALAPRRESRAAVMMLDLDGFKAINDGHGHEAGDKVLKAVGSALLGAVRASDTVARFGGDEFGVLLHDAPDDRALAALMDRIVATVSAPVAVGRGDDEVSVGASIGVGLYPAHGQTPEVLLDRADRAMYAIKNAGKNGWKYFDGDAPAGASPTLLRTG